MEFANGKIVMALEGGYNLNSIAKSVHACVEVLLDGKPISGLLEVSPFESTWRVIKAVWAFIICLKFFNQVKSRYLCFTSRKISIG